MLGRYKIYRGKRPDDDPAPEGIRQDTRKHTRHCLRPTAEMVERFLGLPSDASWNEFASAYRRLLEARIVQDATSFQQLAQLAQEQDVYLGCSCPTKKNPDVQRCHTVLALRFMKQRFPWLEIEIP